MRPSWTLTGLGRALLVVSRYRPVDHMPLVVHLVHFQRSPLCSRGLDRLHLMNLLAITALLAWAAPHSATLRYQARHRRRESAKWPYRLRTYAGRTLADQHPGREQRCSGAGV